MGQSTRIDWCDSTWNPVTGCLHGCEYCYARRIAERFGAHIKEYQWERIHVLDAPWKTTVYEPDGVTVESERACPYPFDFEPTFHRYKLDEPQKWKKPRTIFVCSMADLFGDGEDRPFHTDGIFKWVIVGAETGNRKDRVVPKKEWIDKLTALCDRAGVPIFMKESLREIMEEDFRQEFPWEVTGHERQEASAWKDISGKGFQTRGLL